MVVSVVVTPSTGHIISISDCATVNTADVELWHTDGFWEHMVPGEIFIGDKGYQGGLGLISPFKTTRHSVLSYEEVAANHTLSSVRMIVERTIGRIKNFAILANKYRGDWGNHVQAFTVISHLVNLEMDTHPMISQGYAREMKIPEDWDLNVQLMVLKHLLLEDDVPE